TKLLWQAADVVVRLDGGGRTIRGGPAFNHVRIESSLSKKAGAFDPFRLVFEHVDEHVADDPPLLLRVADAGEGMEEAFPSIDDVQVGLKVITERAAHRLGFTPSQQTVIDENTGHL